MRVYCNADKLVSIVTPGRRTILRWTVNGRVWARRRGDHYVCEKCGRKLPGAW